jgi:prepilin-type N-terminal cleavage/methylation domain-containing protein
MIRKAHGFTLIEIMLTVAIIGLGLTVVFLQVDTFLPASRLQAGASGVVSDLEQLRLATIMLYRKPVHLVYDLSNHGYFAYLPYELDEEAEIIGPGETEILPFKALPENIVFKDVQVGLKTGAIEEKDRVTVLIQPDGSVTGHIVHIMDTYYEKEHSVRVASLTGFAEIIDHRVEYEQLDDRNFQ